MIKVAVAGAAGQMGKRVLHAIRQSSDMQLVGALEAPGHPLLGTDAGVQAGIAGLGVPISADLDGVLGGADVLIDFTRPEASLRHLARAVSHGRAVVIGTTGFRADQAEEIRRLGPSTRCVISPNMSLGVNLIWRLLKDVTRALGDDYDIEIVEAHHRRKVDAPSGTALRMAEVIAETLGRDLRDVAVFSRHGQVGPRRDNEIGIQAIRAGDIVGEHTVIFAGVGERIEIVHRAHSRDNFARGAVRAARWVVGQPPGLYDMQDVLGFKG
ncbi:MAG: 4-hydroxy-tetrahydrodipicolinate reductase [Thermodesulfobacteriota bacterium]